MKERNKPIEPPKKPEKAPFFLPSVTSLSGEILFKVSNEQNGEEKGTQADQFEKITNLPSSLFVQYLRSSVETKNFEPFTDYLKSLSPSTLDMELRMLQIIDDDDEQEPEKRPELLILELVLEYLIHEVSHGNNFEFIQALIRLFLKIHGETMRRHSKLHKLLEAQSAIWKKLDGLFQSARCMFSFLSNTQL